MTGIALFGLSCVLAVQHAASADPGFFWHITDMHWDPTYADGGLSCNEDPGPDRGMWGDFLCDSPWILINSSIYAMKKIEPDPDFLIWTGDDTPHIWNDDILNEQVVRSIIFNITDKIEEVWGDKPIFSTLGNHDWSPKSQLSPYPDPFYDDIAEKWERWLPTPDANSTFRKGGYYASTFGNLTVISLNTNLYYSSNYMTSEMPDPANQMQWFYDQLQEARNNDKKVLVLAHVPPGKFEKHRDYTWFYRYYNEMFTFQLAKFSDVIGSIHMAHHHTDTYRLIKQSMDVVGSILLAPAVAPWETTLDGVMGGKGNNPAIRLVEYDRTTGEVLDVYQYYLDLNQANEDGTDDWQLLYQATEYYNLPDFSTRSLELLTNELWHNEAAFDKYYKANGVLYDPDEVWDEETRIIHVCAISELLYDQYEQCYWGQNGAAHVAGSMLLYGISIMLALYSAY